jgi:polyisoprenoid-binding protein YceI
MTRLAFALALLIALPFSARTETLGALAGTYRVDPASRIAFTVAQLGGQAIEGRFTRFSGRFRLAGEDVSAASVEFTLAPASVVAADPRIEGFIKSASVFDVEAHPAVTFRSTAVRRTGENTATIRGRLTAKGITRDTTFTIRYDGRAGRGLKFHVNGKMSRAMFNMDVGTPIYSNMVVLDMDLIGRRE